MTNYVRMYQDGGLEAVMTTAYQRNDHPLADRFDEVRQGLVDACIHTLDQARTWLAERFDYLVSRESVRKLLHRLGLKRRKVNPFPGKPQDIDAWMEAQRCWIDHLHDLHHRAATEELDLLFCDAAHFVYGKFDNYLWSDGPRFQPSGHGRHRLNVYGAYDVVRGQVLTMYDEDNVDAEYIVGYLDWLRQKHYPDRERPLHLVMDNARYQHCAYVRQHAASLNIVLEFQPGYSPNLNLIERLWKYLKKIMGRHYFASKEEFHQALVQLLERLNNPEHRTKLSALMTMKFQQYEKSQILGC